MSDQQSANMNERDSMALHVREVTVERMYGVAQNGLSAEDLSPGVNIIYGKNATGKTTLARALQALLWPSSAEDHHPTLTGLFGVGEHTYRVDIENGHGRYQRNGQNASRPTLPLDHTRDRYHLYLQELLQIVEESGADGRDQFAEAIRRQAGGGYDVSEAKKALGFAAVTLRRVKSTRGVKKAREQLKAIEKKQKSLLKEEQGLESKEAKLQEARQAASTAEVLHLALEWHEAKAEYKAAEESLKAYPDVMSMVRGDEVEVVEKLRDSIDDKTTAIARQEKKLTEAQVVIENSFLSAEGLPVGFTTEFDSGITDLQKYADAEGQLVQRREKHVQVAQNLWDKILSKATDGEEEAEAIDLSSLRQLIDVAEKAMPTRAEVEAHRRYRDLMANEHDEARLQALEEGTRYLRDWLRSAQPATEETGSGPGLWIVWLVGLFLVVGGVLTAGLLQPAGWMAIGIGALVLLGVILVLAGYLIHRTHAGSTTPTSGVAYRAEYDHLRLDPPSAWTPDEVAAHLRTLEREQAKLRLEERKAEERQRADWAVEESAEQEREIEEVQQQAAQVLGFAPDDAPEMLWWYVQRLSRWQEARSDIDDLDGELASVRENIEAARERLQYLAAPYKPCDIPDVAKARAILEQLRTEDTDVRKAANQKIEATARLKELRREVEERTTKAADLYKGLDLEEGDREGLRALCAKQAAYAEAKTVSDQKKALYDRSLNRLQHHEAFTEELLKLSQDELRDRKRAAEDTAATAEELVDEIARLKQRIASAREAHDLEEAQTAYRSACDKLAAERERDYRSQAGFKLAQFVEQQTRDQSLPAVFKRARALLRTITAGRYELLFDTEQNAFRATDTVAERGLALDELSSGTRIQLLLAVRLAFVEEQEDGWQLPIILDETLANSDDERAGAIIEAIKTLAQAGRQVFYLTAQHTEVAKWEQALGDGHAVDHRLINLSAPSTDVLSEEIGTGALLPATSDLPAPNGLTHAAYGEELGVPGWSPRRPVGEVHLWYLMDDLTALHRLLEVGIATWGQLHGLEETGVRTKFGVEDSEWRRIEARARILKAWKKAWHVGRGRLLSRAALEASGAVSGTFIDTVSDLARDLNGDGEALIAAMREGRVDRFRTHKMEELEDYLLAEGFINPDSQLTPEEVRTRILWAVASEIEDDVLAGEDVYKPIERVEERSRGRSR